MRSTPIARITRGRKSAICLSMKSDRTNGSTAAITIRAIPAPRRPSPRCLRHPAALVAAMPMCGSSDAGHGDRLAPRGDDAQRGGPDDDLAQDVVERDGDGG